MEAHTSNLPDNLVDQLRAKLSSTESRIAQLEHEKREMGLDFEFKRSKIKELYYAKENALREQNTKLFEASRRVSEMEGTIASLQEEIENVKMIASVSENTKAEAVDDLNKHHQEEIESLRCVLQDSMEEQRRDLVLQFERERRHWEQERGRMEQERDEAREMLGETRTMMKLRQEEKDQELEVSMEMAQSEAETLKAVVVPLETEIADLKEKLKSAEEALKEATKSTDRALQNKCEEDFVNIEIEQQGNSLDNDQVKGLNYSLSVEKSSRCDLELYADVISKQKLVLQKENDTLKSEMHEVCRLLEREITAHGVLKETWKAANDQFIDSQKLLLRDMEVVKLVLSDEQWEEIKRLRLKNEVDVDKEILLRKSNQVLQNGVNNGSKNTDPAQDNFKPIASDETSNDDDSFTPFQSHLPPSTTGGSVSTIATEYQDTISVSSLPGAGELAPPDDSSKTQRVLSAPQLNLLTSEDSLHRAIENKKSRINAWDEVPASSMVSHEPTHTEVKQASNEVKSLQEECTSLRQRVHELEGLHAREKSLRAEVEEAVMLASEEAQRQVRELNAKLSGLEARLAEDRSWRKMKETEDDKRLSHLQKDREQIHKQYLHVKKENDFIKSSFEKRRAELGQEHSMPQTAEGLRVQALRYKEALLSVQVEKKHVESKLQSRLSFLQDRLKAEQVAKEQIENALSLELDDTRKELTSLQEIQSKLDKEITDKHELQAQLDKDQLSIETIRTKSREIIKGLKEKLMSETGSKEELEGKLGAAKNQIRSLQSALETSEHVQQDFVRLSQSLQMKLEEIRQQEEEKAKSSKSFNSTDGRFNANHQPPSTANHDPS